MSECGEHRGLPVEISALVIDRTKSMGQTDFKPSRLACAQQAAVEFIKRKRFVDIRDRTCVLGFNTSAEVVSPFGRHPLEAQRDLLGLTAQESTNITAALCLALDVVLREAKGQRTLTLRAVLLSDGEHNTGPSPVADGVLERLRKAGIVVDTVGIGHAGEDLLQAIAAATGGTFVRISDFNSLLGHYHRLAAKRISFLDRGG